LKIKSRETINQKNWVSQFLFVCYQAWMNNRWLKDLTIESGQSGRNKKKKNLGGRETLSWCHVRTTWRELSTGLQKKILIE
jgi:hypothetical protein